MGQDLPITSYALLGLLTFGDELTGYELKQRADSTLRFYWVSPAMSQVYSELTRLRDRGFVTATEAKDGSATTYRLSPAGRQALEGWMGASTPGFPVLKHPVALRLLLGHVVDPAGTVSMLRSHLDALAIERAALSEVYASLQGRDGPGKPFRYPSLVAEWGLEYFDNETRIVSDLIARLEGEAEGEAESEAESEARD